jgi:hypothetical protein
MHGMSDKDGSAANHKPCEKKRKEPAYPDRPGDPKNPQGSHEISLSWSEYIGETVAELIGKDVSLPRDSK